MSIPFGGPMYCSGFWPRRHAVWPQPVLRWRKGFAKRSTLSESLFAGPFRSRRCCASGTTGKSLRFTGIVSSLRLKNIRLFRRRKSVHNADSPSHHEGTKRVVTLRWHGLRWTRPASGMFACPTKRRPRTAKSRGPGAATLASIRTRPSAGSATGARKAVPRGDRV